jgi:hypothetical protein
LEGIGPSDEGKTIIKEKCIGDDVMDALPFDEVIQVFDSLS